MGSLCSCFRGDKRDDESERLLGSEVNRVRNGDYQSSSLRSPLSSSNSAVRSNGLHHTNRNGASGLRNSNQLAHDITVHTVDPDGNYTQECQVDTSINSYYDETVNKCSSTVWDRTLHKLQEKLIDVTTLDINPKVNDHSEWVEKQAEYKVKVESNKLLGPTIDQIVVNRHFTSMAKAPGSHLRHELCKPISPDDLTKMLTFSQEASTFLSNKFIIHSADKIVVPFAS